MSATLLAAALIGLLALSALAGPWVLRQSALVLASAPRIATTVLAAAALLWITALVAIGPVIAWMSAGPAWLPGYAGRVCSRCVAAATPFSSNDLALGIPAAVPLAVPILGAAAVLVGVAKQVRQMRRASLLSAGAIRNARSTSVLGHRVMLVDSATPYVYALPRQHGGIVISGSALEALTTTELSAVLEHEQAHLRQRHHLVLTVVYGATHFFRWVPLIGAIRDSVSHYLEIAADQAAQRVTGTRALVTALLKLGTPTNIATPTPAVALHAVDHATTTGGSDRVRYLVGVERTPVNLAFAMTAAILSIALVSVIASVHWPYFFAIATGC